MIDTNLSGQVVDASTGSPLAKATIALDGVAVGITDSNGNFSIPYPTEAQTVNITYVGYQEQDLPAEEIYTSPQIQMSPIAQTLPEVTVIQKITKKNYAPYLLGAAGVGLLLLSGKKSKRMRGVGKINTETILIIAAAGVGVYLLTRRATPPTPVYVPVSTAQAQQNSTAQIITAGAGAANAIANIISAI